MDKINRQHPGVVDKERNVVVVLGITGSGKSSTANTIRGSKFHQFEVSDSIASVTRSIGYKDFYPTGTGPLSKIPFRVIDTPGLMDTNRDPTEIQDEFKTLQMLAPHGVAAFVICIPMGRVTDEHERALKQIVAMFGPEIMRHSIIAVTAAVEGRQLLYRDQLFAKIATLPVGHFLRTYVEGSDWRVVGVENKVEPARTTSQLRLLQSVIDVLQANKGKRFLLEPDFGQRKAPSGADRVTAISSAISSTIADARCSHALVTHPDGRKTLTITCEIPK